MVSKSVLVAGKAYLCWDLFNDLSIQLVAVQGSAGYYYPPHNPDHSIVLFYTNTVIDFSEPLFLLFHEAGHAQQWIIFRKENMEGEFRRIMNIDRGRERVDFETEAWKLGRMFFSAFIQKENLGMELLKGFDDYKDECIRTYIIAEKSS